MRGSRPEVVNGVGVHAWPPKPSTTIGRDGALSVAYPIESWYCKVASRTVVQSYSRREVRKRRSGIGGEREGDVISMLTASGAVRERGAEMEPVRFKKCFRFL